MVQSLPLRQLFCVLLATALSSGCYLSREMSSNEQRLSDAGTNDAPAADARRLHLLPTSCRLSDCYRIFSDERGLADLDGEACCFDANCTDTDPTPVRRAWVVSCHEGTVHATEVFPLRD